MIWNQFRGHMPQREMMQQSIARGRLSHAYLFLGPDGIGKKKFAYLLAQCLFCQKTEDAALEACGECSACRQVLAETHPDFLTVGCAPGKAELTIDVFLGAKERRGKEGLCHEMSLRPMAGTKKIAVIDDANAMNDESANALLKTLEEPQAHSLLILIGNNSDAILPTIRSRCQLLQFAPLSETDTAELLLEQEMVHDDTDAANIAAMCGGSLTVAAQLLDPQLRQARQQLFQRLATPQLNGARVSAEMISVVEEIGGDSAAQRRSAIWIVRYCAEFYRLAALQMSGSPLAGAISQVGQFASGFNADVPEDVELVMSLFDRTVETETQIERMSPFPLCLETLFGDLSALLRNAKSTELRS